MSDVIAEGMVVGYRFKMSRKDTGELLGSSGEEELAFYLHGADNVPPGLEQGMTGKTAGDKFELDVAAEGAFGERQEVEPMAVPKAQFGEGSEIAIGANVVAESPNGQQHMLFVSGVDDENVFLDPNHPLAGVDVNFAIEVVSLRKATDEEREHGHPHEGEHAHH